MLASAAAVLSALRRVRTADQRGFIGGLVGALVLAGAGGIVQYLDIAGLGFDGTTHAYGSIFFTLAGFIYVVTIGAMIAVAMMLFWAIRGLYTVRRHAAIANVARFWALMVVVWVVGFGTLYLGPHLT
jgi:cytochrome c oxidase subunit I+III